MTVFYTSSYVVGGQETHGGDRETHHDAMPEGLRRVWEIDPSDPWDKTPWVLGDNGLWAVEGQEDEGLALSWTELLDEFAPVSDDEADAAMGLAALAARNAASEVADVGSPAVEPVVPERVAEILDGLNAFVARPGADNLDLAVGWVRAQPDVAAAEGPLLGEASVELVDATLIEWRANERRWAVTAEDDTEGEVSAR